MMMQGCDMMMDMMKKMQAGEKKMMDGKRVVLHRLMGGFLLPSSLTAPARIFPDT